MRQLLVQVPRGRGTDVLEVAYRHDAANVARLEAMGLGGPIDLVMLHVSNARVESVLEELEAVPDLHVTLVPRGVITLKPPATEAPEQVTDVAARSAIEVFLAGLQSVGSWRGFLGYAAAAGAVVWIGLFTNTVYLLTAAMLIAPFAGPAMNAAIATARGDARLLARGLARYFAALAVTIAVALALTLVMRAEIPTEQMVERSQVSTVAVLLPLVAGAAGALTLVQSERSSLVSGAAVGMLVAASLAPPAGLIGMAGAIGRWDMAQSGLFLLLLQLVGINLSGAIVFRLYGVSARGARYARGRRWLFPAAMAATVAALAALLTWQFGNPPELQRATRTQRAAIDVRAAIEESGLARFVEANVRFTRADIEGQNTMLVLAYVQRPGDAAATPNDIRARLTRDIQARLLAHGVDVTPLVNLTVLDAPTRP